MRTTIKTFGALLLASALPATAALHPDAVCGAPNAVGNPVCCVTSGVTGSTICVNNIDDSGLGFNDPGAAIPGATGNPGATLGEQRLNAFFEASRIWGDTLTTPVSIVVQGTFQDRGATPCLAASGVLGAAGTIQIFSFDGIYGAQAVWPSTWYHTALINRLVGFDVAPGGPDPGFLEDPGADDIIAFFNPNVGQAACITGSGWYYGFDNAEPVGGFDFLSVLLHEMGHGLGHANFIDENGSPNNCTTAGNCVAAPGSGPANLPDIYTVFSRDWTNQKHWNQMSDGERVASSVRDELVWDGPNTATAAALYLGDAAGVVENSPDSELFRAQESTYTPAPTLAGVTGDLVLWTDPVDTSGDPNDNCEGTYCDPNAAGNIVLINRGSCNFSFKSAVAELCGATGVIIANHLPTGLPSMGGTPLIAHTTTSVGISNGAGNALKADLAAGTVNVTILKDGSITGQAGADRDGFPRLYAPNPLAPGSSISHWDTTLTPNTMMEPFINADLLTATTLDLSPAQMADIGWDGSVYCPANADSSPSIVIDGCDSGVANFAGPWTILPTPRGKGVKRTSGNMNSGCYLADLFHSCVGNTTHGDFVNCATNTATTLVKQGVLFSSEADAIMACVESADLP